MKFFISHKSPYLLAMNMNLFNEIIKIIINNNCNNEITKQKINTSYNETYAFIIILILLTCISILVIRLFTYDPNAMDTHIHIYDNSQNNNRRVVQFIP